jgi:hypothetical protein
MPRNPWRIVSKASKMLRMNRLRRLACLGIDIALVAYALAFLYRLLLGPFVLDLWLFDISFTRYPKPLTAIAVLLGWRFFLSDWVWNLPVSDWVGRLVSRVGRLVVWGTRVRDKGVEVGGRVGETVARRTPPPPPKRLALLVAGILYAVVVAFNENAYYFDFTPFWSDPITNISSPAGEILTDRMGDEFRFIENIRHVVRADEAILLETDERPYFVNYYLYPRRVYMHDQAIELLERRTTSDPNTEVVLHPHPPDEECPLVRSRNIEWRVHYYPGEPRRNRIEWVAPPQESAGAP